MRELKTLGGGIKPPLMEVSLYFSEVEYFLYKCKYDEQNHLKMILFYDLGNGNTSYFFTIVCVLISNTICCLYLKTGFVQKD
ncbi:hypothetical protein BAGA_09155 [Bacillus gaemokensis]|uniref:Uncharacterized protein n=1 Tax=Bacillus gaemokensis TaxID=574375 RepID=A0A073KAJ1_9BACI|nr:hypothetical protein BAGA_09155 [Bacillus gaemokensis]KYG25817.1 hypothetical protein AZF08_17410 [Bacillus gaemokensis]